MTQATAETCPVCLDYPAFREEEGNLPETIEAECPRCGPYTFTRISLPLLRDESSVSADNGEPRLGPPLSPARLEASAWLREHPSHSVNSKEVASLAALPRLPVLTLADQLLSALARVTEFPGYEVDLNEPEWRARCRARDRRSVHGVVGLLQELGYVEIGEQTMGEGGQDPVRVVAGGWHRLAELERPNEDSEQGFVAMWFDEPMTSIYDDILAKAIDAAGYRPHRVDRREFAGRIDDEIVAQIRRSRFVVADFTGHRGGVYWEAGLAEGLGLPVFFTCRDDVADKLHFDVRQQNTIRWAEDDTEELRRRLQARIEAVLGKGPLSRSPQDS